MAERQIIEAEGESLEVAREQVKSQIPEGFRLLAEKVISDGQPRTVKGIAETTEEAIAKAQGGIPANASVLETKEVATSGQKLAMVDAFDEQSARAQAAGQFGDTAIVKAIRLTAAGKKGFLGIGKKPNQYEVEVFHQAVVEITYKTLAKISAEIGRERIYDGPPIRDLTQEGLISQLQRMGMSPGEADLKVQMALRMASILDRGQIEAIHSSGEPLTLESLPLRWAAHCIHHGARPLTFR